LHDAFNLRAAKSICSEWQSVYQSAEQDSHALVNA